MSYKDLHIFIHILFQMQDRCKFSTLLLLEMHYVFCSSCSLRPLEEREIVRLSRSRRTESRILQTGAESSSRCLHSLLIPLKEAAGCRERERGGGGGGVMGENIIFWTCNTNTTQTANSKRHPHKSHFLDCFYGLWGKKKKKKKLNCVHGCWFTRCFRDIKIKLWGNPFLIG